MEGLKDTISLYKSKTQKWVTKYKLQVNIEVQGGLSAVILNYMVHISNHNKISVIKSYIGKFHETVINAISTNTQDNFERFECER